MSPLVFLLLLSLDLGLGEQQVASPRSTRTLGSFFGYGRDSGGSVQSIQQQEVVKPLVYQVRYYDGKVAAQVPVPVQGVEKVGVGVVDGVQQQQQGKVQQYYGVSPPGVGVVPVGGNYIYVQVPYPVQQPYGPGQVQGPSNYPYGGHVGPYPCPVEYVYVYDATAQRQRPVGQQGQVVQTPGVVQPVPVQHQGQQGSPVTYTNRVRPPQFSPQVGVQQQQQVVQQGQVPVGVVPIPVPSVYDYYYGNGGQFGYYPGVSQQNAPYYPHYYNPVVSPSSDYFYYVQKPIGGSGDKQGIPQGQGQVQQQVVSPTEVSKKQE